MTPDQIVPDFPLKKAIVPEHFDPRSATQFINKSISEETRQAYRRAVTDFFQFVGDKHPTEVVPADVLGWRDYLRSRRKRAATVSFKLSVIRSFFEYLRAGGVIALNPASTKLVTPPELPTEPAGRALTSREVRYLLIGPDRSKAEGARDYALMLVMLRLSLRVAEVCALKASSVITKSLAMGQSCRQVQMMSKHKDPKTVMRYDHGRENLEQNAVNFLQYGDD